MSKKVAPIFCLECTEPTIISTTKKKYGRTYRYRRCLKCGMHYITMCDLTGKNEHIVMSYEPRKTFNFKDKEN